jgi:tetratricopeptide (TPR) repeat protein
MDEASYGPDHPDVARDLNNLALLLKATNRLSEAEPLYRRALAIDEASYGSEHPNVAIRLNNLASLLYATNRLSEAEPLMRRALAIDEASYGPEHPNVARDLNNLALLLQATNRLSDAEPLSRRVLLIFLSFLRQGFQHPNLQAASENYTSVLVDMGLSEEEAQTKIAAIISEATGKLN